METTKTVNHIQKSVLCQVNDIVHVPDWDVHDSPEMPYPWVDGHEREEILDRFIDH
jgi:hypothetical protein